MKTLKRAYQWLVTLLVSIFTGLYHGEVGAVALPLDLEYEINETDENFTLGTDVAAGGGDGVTAFLYGRYVVPNGVDLVFLPNHEFQFYGYDLEASAAEFTDYVPIEIISRDMVGQGSLPRLKGLYVNMKFAANTNDKKKMNNKWRAKGRERIEIWVIPEDSKSMDVSACHFSLTCRRIAPQLSA